jgi:superfamily I DNA/RNA helicase
MGWDDNLPVGSPAYEVAASIHIRIRVLAGPGAGKSFAMKRRVARLLEIERIIPTKILPVTFTRVAAEELHRELAPSLPPTAIPAQENAPNKKPPSRPPTTPIPD